MRTFKYFFTIIITSSVLFISCSTVPLTRRSRLHMLQRSEMLTMSYQQYNQFLKKSKLRTNLAEVDMVKLVRAKIQQAVKKYMLDHAKSGRLRGYKWEFNLVEDEQVNAWCMPGGKVVVYTGILPVTQG